MTNSKPGFSINVNAKGKFAVTGDIKQIAAVLPIKAARTPSTRAFPFSTSSLQEYWEAKPAVNNPAGRQIDNGREPYLFNLQAWQLDLEPFVTIYDLMIAKRGTLVGVDLGQGPVYLEPDTLVVWR